MIKTLVIEDHAVVRAGICQLLNQENDIEVIGAAENGRHALELLENGLRPDIVLSDMHLGDVSGIDLAKTLRQTYPDIKIVVLTMETSEHYLSEAFRAGVNGYLLKETEYDEVVFAIRKVNQSKFFICTGLASILSKRIAREPDFVKRTELEIDFSNREMEILHLLADGYTNLEIADRLFTSKKTVEGHRQSLLNKTGVRNTPELIKFAMINGILNPVIS